MIKKYSNILSISTSAAWVFALQAYSIYYIPRSVSNAVQMDCIWNQIHFKFMIKIISYEVLMQICHQFIPAKSSGSACSTKICDSWMSEGSKRRLLLNCCCGTYVFLTITNQLDRFWWLFWGSTMIVVLLCASPFNFIRTISARKICFVIFVSYYFIGPNGLASRDICRSFIVWQILYVYLYVIL